jgi:hypothetical protein
VRTRVCSRCRKEKNLDTEFTRHRESKGGRLSFCKECKAIEDRTYYEDPNNQSKIKDRARRYYHNNREKRRLSVRNYQRDKKIQAVAVKGGVCEVPGCEITHPAALQFHHRDPTTKLFEISTGTLSSPRKFPWEVILREIEKCDLLCANHHAIQECTWEIE